jgi:hypothetical protein
METEKLLASIMRAGKRTVVVDIQMIVDRNYPEWADVLERLDLTEDTSTGRVSVGIYQPSAISRLIAEALITGDPELDKLAAELRALTIRPGATTSSLSLVKAAAVQLDELCSEIGLLRDTLAVELDAAADQAALTDKRIKTLRQELAINDRERAVLKSTVSGLRLERRQCDGQIAELRAEIQQKYAEIRSIADAVEIANAELAKVYASKSWRITGPLRVTRRQIGGGFLVRVASYLGLGR